MNGLADDDGQVSKTINHLIKAFVVTSFFESTYHAETRKKNEQITEFDIIKLLPFSFSSFLYWNNRLPAKEERIHTRSLWWSAPQSIFVVHRSRCLASVSCQQQQRNNIIRWKAPQTHTYTPKMACRSRYLIASIFITLCILKVSLAPQLLLSATAYCFDRLRPITKFFRPKRNSLISYASVNLHLKIPYSVTMLFVEFFYRLKVKKKNEGSHSKYDTKEPNI